MGQFRGDVLAGDVTVEFLVQEARRWMTWVPQGERRLPREQRLRERDEGGKVRRDLQRRPPRAGSQEARKAGLGGV